MLNEHQGDMFSTISPFDIVCQNQKTVLTQMNMLTNSP